jgi:hypothetical protein
MRKDNEKTTSDQNERGAFLRSHECQGLRVDVLKLRIPIDMLSTFSCLVVGLQAVAHVAQKIADNGRRRCMPFLRQVLYKIAQAAARPQQQLRQITRVAGSTSALRSAKKLGSCTDLLFRTPPSLANTSRRGRCLVANIA